MKQKPVGASVGEVQEEIERRHGGDRNDHNRFTHS